MWYGKPYREQEMLEKHKAYVLKEGISYKDYHVFIEAGRQESSADFNEFLGLNSFGELYPYMPIIKIK